MLFARDLLGPTEKPPPVNNEDAAARQGLISDKQSIAEVIPVPSDLDVTGDVTKADSFPFESGGVADVCEGSVINSRKITEKHVAIKVFRRIHTDGDVIETIQDLYGQCKLWTRLTHPNILCFLGVALDLGPSPALISPLYRSPGIMKYLSEGPKSSQERYEIIQGIAQGLVYLHSQGLVHGNLRTKKVLISDDGKPILCGYGLANISTQSSKNSPVYTPISPSARFTAPEYYINAPPQESSAPKNHRTRTGDVYSFSMVVLEIMSGIRPFHHLNDDISVVLHILPGGRPSRSELDPLLVSNRLWGFLKQLWNHQPALRPEMNRVTFMLQSLRSDSDKPDAGVTEIGSSILYSNVDEFDIEEEVSFGHPCLAEINSQNLSGRLFRTDEYPYATGGNSNIYRGQLMHRNGYKIRIAIKLIRVSNDGSGQLEELLRRLKKETRVWSSLNHRNILPFLGVWDEPIAPWPALISPFYNSGHLKKYLMEHPTADKEKIIIGVTAGIEYLHRHGIIHGDLKVHNVLVDKNGRPCICDFGISRIINARGFTTSSVGTPPYMAPELFIVLGDVAGVNFQPGPTTLSSDVYSVALLILEILTANPLKHRPLSGILTVKDHSSLRPRRSDYDSASVSTDFWSLLDRCWESNPDLRPSIHDLILRMPLSASRDRIFSRFSNIPVILPAVRSLWDIIQACQKLSQNRHAAGQLSNRCHRLLLELLEQYADDESTKLAVQAVTDCLLKIEAKINVWAKEDTTRIQAFLHQDDVAKDIESSHSLLSAVSVQSKLLSHLDTHENIHVALNAAKDNQDLMDYLASLEHAQTILQELVTAQHSDVTQLMAMMQKFLGSLSPDRENYLLFYILQRENLELLPDFHLRSGEVVLISQYPVSAGGIWDVYKGLYLGKEKVAIKVLRAVNADERSLRRFRREGEIWKSIWQVDKGRHVLPFYGFCQEGVAFPYMVSPWMENGSALQFVKKQINRIDYRKLIKGIASGLQVLHTVPLIHGNLKASNMIINDAGQPLIADFGLSRMVEEITGIPFSQSRGVGDSYRWFAPELCVGGGSMSRSSDIYAYGMTVLELLTHKQPWSHIKHTTEVVILSSSGVFPRRPMDPEVVERGLDDDCWALLERCWALDPKKRPTVQEILSCLPA